MEITNVKVDTFNGKLYFACLGVSLEFPECACLKRAWAPLVSGPLELPLVQPPGRMPRWIPVHTRSTNVTLFGGKGVDPSMMKRHLAMLSGNEVSGPNDDNGCPTGVQIFRCDFSMANPDTA